MQFIKMYGLINICEHELNKELYVIVGDRVTVPS